MPTRNINLTEHLNRFVERQVSSGRYSNASEIVREALRILEEQEHEWQAKKTALRHAAREGFDQIDQGKGIALQGKRNVKQFIRKLESGVESSAASSDA